MEEMRKLHKKARLKKCSNKKSVSFREFVLEKNIEVEDIAKKCGVAYSTARNWVKGNQWPSTRYRYHIAINFGFKFR